MAAQVERDGASPVSAGSQRRVPEPGVPDHAVDEDDRKGARRGRALFAKVDEVKRSGFPGNREGRHSEKRIVRRERVTREAGDGIGKGSEPLKLRLFKGSDPLIARPLSIPNTSLAH